VLSELANVFIALGNINLCLNPLIYASRYEVFRKSLRKMLKRDNTVAPWCSFVSAINTEVDSIALVVNQHHKTSHVTFDKRIVLNVNEFNNFAHLYSLFVK